MYTTFRALLGVLIVQLGAVPTALAADGVETAYIVTYFEVKPPTGRTLALLRELSKASRKEAGNLRFEVLQRIGQSDQFVILEAWKDQNAHAAHAAASHTRAFRDKLQPLLRSPYDERPHTALAVGPMPAAPDGAAKKSAIYAVTHVDIVPKAKDVGVELVKQLSAGGRKDPGNVRFESLTQTSRPNHMTVVEVWSDRKAGEAHGVTDDKKVFREKLMPLSGSLYDERFYRAYD